MTGRKLRVLHVIDSTDSKTGGPIQSILQLARHQIHDVDISLVTLDSPEDESAGVLPFSVYYLGKVRSTRKVSGAFRFTPALVIWLRKHADTYDIVVLHGIWTFAPLGAWLALWRKRVPYVVFTHGMLDPWFRQAYPMKHVKKQLFWTLFLGRLLEQAKSVIFTAEDEKLLARNSFYGFQSYREDLVPLGVDRETNHRETCIRSFRDQIPALQERKFILFLSRIHPKKGCDILIEAFSEFAQRNADIDLVVAGPDPLGWRTLLEQKAGRQSSRIHWPGMLTGAAKWGAFYAADAFILPSHQENFGIAVTEAMSCALPVLISNKINIWREIDRSGAGLVADDTLSGTLSLLDRFADLDHLQKRQMAENAERCQLQYFDAKNNAKACTDLLRKVIYANPRTG